MAKGDQTYPPAYIQGLVRENLQAAHLTQANALQTNETASLHQQLQTANNANAQLTGMYSL